MKCGLLGEKLGHSYSPLIYEKLGIHGYALYEHTAGELGDFFKDRDFDYINVTVPYKKAAAQRCDTLVGDATALGAVNTVVNRGGKLFGYNTDTEGFLYMLNSAGFSPAGKKVLILGSGGASAAVLTVLERLGAGKTVVISRTGRDNYTNLSLHADADMIVNATPVGMYPYNQCPPPVELSVFPQCGFVCDLIYNPDKTPLLLAAQERGIPFSNGLPMLVAQAAAAARIAAGIETDAARISDIARELRRSKLNIVLIGMPGCGKSSIGKALAQKLSRPLFETDEMVAEKTGSLAFYDLIGHESEQYFRWLETNTCAVVGRGSGSVISTGGGVITTPANFSLLRQNSAVVFIKRDIDALATDGRPLSKSRPVLWQMYEKRLPLYLSMCDFIIENDSTVDAAAEKIAAFARSL